MIEWAKAYGFIQFYRVLGCPKFWGAQKNAKIVAFKRLERMPAFSQRESLIIAHCFVSQNEKWHCQPKQEILKRTEFELW